MNLSTSPTNAAFNPVFVMESRDKNKLRKMLSHKHMIETIERFEWKNLPPELNADLVERVLYFRYKGALFKYNDKHYFLPFALSGTIDPYGRYEEISPVLFTGQFDTQNKKKQETLFLPSTVSNVKFTAKYALNQEPSEYDAVILTDSSLEVSQDWEPMNTVITPLIDQQLDILVLLNIDLVTSAKVFYIVAKDENQKEAIEAEFEGLDRQILEGKRVVVLTSTMELKELQGNTTKDSARYMQSFQSIDNLRKEIIGLENGGQFQKMEHMTEMETEVNTASGSSVIENALRMRKEFCKLANKFFGLNIDVDIKGQGESEIVAPEGAHTKQQEGRDDDVL
jgi:hypothetical protein